MFPLGGYSEGMANDEAFSADDPNNPWYCGRCGFVHSDGECDDGLAE